MTLYDELKAAGIPLDSHESDLYVLNTPEARAILAKYPSAKGAATTFTSQVDGKRWIDIPFAFMQLTKDMR